MDASAAINPVATLLQVLLIDLALTADNAVVVGLAVSGLPKHRRRSAIAAGVLGATLLRIGLAVVALRLLEIIGLVLAGGLLLLWVAWKMYRELRRRARRDAGHGRPKSFGQAIVQIVVADLSMSFDNVLAVAGAAAGHVGILVAGLVVSIVLMGVAATAIAALLERRRWLAWAGLLMVLYVALRMIWRGSLQVLAHAH
ncbi:MAG: YjbE family putative metal transport protein [Gammaproteobacteria bacterium]|nr:YjbE family putative metal transport protein [Gammaproteobacteria bacterium]